MLAQQQKELSLDVANGQTVKGLIEVLNSEYPAIGDLILKKKVLISVNQEIAHPDSVINGSDEIALLPPFSGGA